MLTFSTCHFPTSIIPAPASPHWATSLIGRPWSPDWHCWELVRGVYKDQLHVVLPTFPGVDPTNTADYGRAVHAGCSTPEWERLKLPEEFAVVAMSRGSCFHHVGVWTNADGGRVVHAQDGTCTVADSLQYLRRTGWKRIEFFKWRAS